MLNLSYFEPGNVLNITVTRLRLSKVCVLVNNASDIPLLELSSHSNNTTSSVLYSG